MNKIATVLLFVNFVTVLFPQPGYIHPDEFFQSTEIVAGDILGVSHVRAWEFNTSSPVRNLVFPYLLTGPSLHLLRWINSLNVIGLKISAVKVVMATRLPMAFVSLFGYLATGQLSKRFETDVYLSKIMWCSSYVTWIYFTRTFSNSVEAFLLAFIFVISLNNISTTATNSVKQSKSIKKKKEETKSNKSKKGDKNKPSSGEESADVDGTISPGKKETTAECDGSSEQRKPFGGTAFVLGFVLVAGFFNRPTFLLFAFTPMVYWFFDTCLSAKRFFRCALYAILMCSIGMISAFSLFVLADTFYYNPLFCDTLSTCWDKVTEAQYSLHSVLKSWELITSSLIVTPWNFLKYNMNKDNLANHGLHPPYTHFLVNLPLLVGPLFFPILAASLLSFIQLLTRSKRLRSSHSIWLVLMAIVPITGLSLFPHQEPRFLVPLLPILVVLGAKLVSYMATGKKLFIVIWVIFNILLNLVYGYLHQAALIPALSIYQQKLASPKKVAKMIQEGTHHAFFYKTYPPPLHLFLLDPTQTHFQVHDLAGAPVKNLVLKVKAIEKQRWVTKGKNQVFIFLPSTASDRVIDLLSSDLKDYDLQLSTTSICPHLSVESLPRFKRFWAKRITLNEFLMDFCLNVIKIA